MAENITIVTPTNRLSEYLRVAHAREQIKQGHQAWQTLDSLPWNAWCKRLYESLSLNHIDTPVLLSDAQQLWLWQKIINRSRYREQLLQVPAVAKQAMYTYQLCKQWQIPIFPNDVFKSEDAIAFAEWSAEYEKEKKKHGYLEGAGLPDYLAQHAGLVDEHEAQLVFQGFDVFTRQQLTLIEALKTKGINISVVDIDDKNTRTIVYAANDKTGEIKAAACWAREKLQQQPDATIGIVTPRLRYSRQQIQTIFTSILSPAHVIDPYTASGQAWSITLGKPLIDYPMINTAMELLSLGRRSISVHQLGKLLHSRFIKGVDEELASRANLDAELRQAGEQELTLKTLYWFIENRIDEHSQCGQFLQLLKDFEISFLSHARQQTLRQWAILFSEWLTGFGWPGEVALDSEEHQTLKQWQDTLIELSRLDPATEKLGYFSALTQLQRLLQDKQFQPETPETPIQVSGMTGCAAMQFDFLWIMEMQDDIWPEQPVPNSFIPRQCQLNYGIPTASAEGQFNYAKQLTDRLVRSSGEAVLSYSLHEGERECRPSSLTRGWDNPKQTLTFSEFIRPQRLLFDSSELETFLDIQAPNIKKGQLAQGNSSLFKDQSQCPFRAFARHRLHAKSLSATDIGLSAAERGNLTHRVMQYLWQRLGDQETLLYRSENELNKLIHSVVSESIKQHKARQPETFSQRFAELEQRRLELLLKNWLEIEREREAFRVIGTEESHAVRYFDIDLRLRIDRMDELADGRCVIIDYKTGLVSKRDWESDNPNDPQLPLYAITQDKQIAALAYASLKPGKLGYYGHSDGDDILPGVKTDASQSWQTRMDDWQQVLQRLAEDYRQGNATVEPLEGACRYCDLPGLCRIYQRTETLDAEAIAESDFDD